MNTGPTVRLAYNPGPVNSYKALNAPPTTPDTKNGGRAQKQSQPLAPALLVSYVYLPGFLKHRHRYHYRDWVLDSGAFSAHNSGVEIKLQDYIDTCKQLFETDSTLTEVFALDVIGDWRASLKNCEEMWRQGVPAIPCFHAGEPWEALMHMARDYPKIALGGVAYAGGNRKMKWAEQCFARVWPKKIHGFGFGSESQIMGLPWHSTDATNWEIGPCRFGRWQSFGQMSVRGSNQNLRAEVEWYLELERKAQFRWRKEMAQLAKLKEPAPAVRLSLGGNMRDGGEQRGEALAGPHVRLAHSAQVRPKREGKIGLEKKYSEGAETVSPSVRLACCMSESEGGSWGARNMKQALGKEHYVKKEKKKSDTK